MAKNEASVSQMGNNGIGQDAAFPADPAPQMEEVKVNNPALLARYVEAATLAQERLLAYLSGVLGERGIQGEVRGWDVPRGVIIVAAEGDSAGSSGATGVNETG